MKRVDTVLKAARCLAAGRRVEVVVDGAQVYFLVTGRRVRKPSPAQIQRALTTLGSPLLKAA